MTKYISFIGEISLETIKPFIEHLDVLREDSNITQVELTLTTLGGYFTAAFGLYDYLTMYPKPIDIVATGCCHSCGVLILQSGARRLSRPNTTFMLHRGWHDVPFSKNVADVQADVSNFERQEKLYFHLVAQRSQIKEKGLIQLCSSEHYFTNVEALDLGLIDKVIAAN
jgi:ATP-dependent protease ClpP protease subunit